MRVLMMSQYFTPEITAAPVRLHPFAAGLASRGHRVEVVCEVPSHPHGVVSPGYRGRPVQRRWMDGFRVTYVWAHASPSKLARHRLASYATYAAMSAAVAGLRGRPDVVLASSPPLSVGAVGALTAARHRVPWVFDVRDLWPEVAVAIGELGEGRALAAAEWLERRLYNRATRVTTPTEPFRAHIAQRCDDPGKVAVVANGTTREWLDAGEAAVSREELALPEDSFVWCYSGNVGLSQDLDTALDAAAILGDGFQLLVVGDGPSKPRLVQRASELPPGAVRFVGLREAREAARYMRASDALLVPLADRPELGKSIPIKLYDCCAIGRPVIVAAPGEPRRIAERHGAALTVSPADPRALAEGVRRLREDRGLRRRLGRSGRDFAAGHLRERGVERLEDLLAELL